MDINLSPRDRSRLYRLAEDRNFDPVEVILQKARAYDEAVALLKASLNLTVEDVSELDLVTIVKALLQTQQQMGLQITMLHKNIAGFDHQLKRLVSVCEEQGVDLGLTEKQKSWMSQK